ncbi:conserved hypothetical protein [Cupriavidus taiwanensis]|nr:conserved hypothetical protein [Cupriavidus taiwanensis]
MGSWRTLPAAVRRRTAAAGRPGQAGRAVWKDWKNYGYGAMASLDSGRRPAGAPEALTLPA